MSIAYSPSIVMSGLVLCFDAANQKCYNVGIATTAFNDLTGNGNNGRLIGGVGYEDNNRGILRFDGVNDYVDCGPVPAIGSSLTGLTVNVWINSSARDVKCIAENGTNYTTNTFYMFQENANYFTFAVWGGQGLGYDVVYANFVYQTNTWYNLTGVWSSNNRVELYCNGVLCSGIKQGTVQTSVISGNTNLLLGSRNYGSFPFSGKYSYASFYNRALTATEIQQNYNAIKSRFPTTNDLLLYLDAGNTSSYPGSGTVWTDLSGNDNNATLVNGVGYSNEYGGALTFDGVNDYALVNLEPYIPYCIDIWFYNNDDITSAIIPGPYQQLLGVGTYPGGISLGDWTGSATGETFGMFSSTWFVSGGMTYIKDNAPAGNHNLVINWNGSNYDFWLDGTKRTTYASTFGHCILQARTGLEIGRDSGGGYNYEFNGKVYSLKIHTSSLSDAQIQENYNVSKPRFESLIPIVTNGLVLNLDAGNTNSYAGIGTIWTDLSGNGNNGTLGVGTTSVPTYSSSNGGSLVFDGSNDYVTLSSSQIAPGTGAFTWNFWVKSTRTQQNYSIVFSGTGSNTNYGVIVLSQTVGVGLAYYANGFRIQDADTSFFGNWIYVSFVGNGGSSGSRTLKLYKNGVQAGSTYTFDYNFTATTPYIGANHSAISEVMGGNISNVSYYNRELTAAEIQQNYNSLRGRFGL